MSDQTDAEFTLAFNQDAERDQLRDALRSMAKKMAKLKDRHDAITEAAYDGALAAIQSFGKPVMPPAPKLGRKRGKPEVALLHMTDWQGAKVTTSYNTAVMEQRVMEFVKVATGRILDIQRADHSVDEFVAAFGGDMIEGLFNYPAQAFEIDADLYLQVVTVARLIERVIRALCASFKHGKVVPEWGNHGRIGSKRDAVKKSDNMDRFVYRLAREMLRDLIDAGRLEWQDSPEDIQRLEVGNYRALVIHGDEFGRSGYASPTTIVNHVNRWRSGAYDWEFRDVYIGHYHNAQEIGLANGQGRVFFTGSTESDNRYARDGMSANAIPSQRLHFVEPVKGSVTAQYHIPLAEHADLGAEKPEILL